MDSKEDGRGEGWIRMKGETSRLGRLGQMIERKDFNKYGVGREDGKVDGQTCERDGQWR